MTHIHQTSSFLSFWYDPISVAQNNAYPSGFKLVLTFNIIHRQQGNLLSSDFQILYWKTTAYPSHFAHISLSNENRAKTEVLQSIFFFVQVLGSFKHEELFGICPRFKSESLAHSPDLLIWPYRSLSGFTWFHSLRRNTREKQLIE